MSKISAKKAECGYEDKPVNRMCSNCAHFTLDRVLTPWMPESNARRIAEPGRFQTNPEPYTVEKNGVEKNMRCTRNGFAVKKMARCGDWEAGGKA